jgi:hypothetical protein
MSHSDNKVDRKVTGECEEDEVTECEDWQHTNSEGGERLMFYLSTVWSIYIYIYIYII